jgi:hypothetical protein
MKPLTLRLGFLPLISFCCLDFHHSRMLYCFYSCYVLGCYSDSNWYCVHQHLAFLDNIHFVVLLTTPSAQLSTTLFTTSGNAFVNSQSWNGHYCVCCLCLFVFTFVFLMCIWNFVSPLCAKMLIKSKDDFEVCEG